MKSVLFVAPTFLLALQVLIGLPGNAPAQATPVAPTRVAHVSAQRVINETAVGKAEMAKMQAAQQQRAADLRTKQQALEATRAEIYKGGDQASMAKLGQQEQQQRLEFERAAAQMQTDLQGLHRQIQTDLQAKVRPLIEEIAKARNVDIVLSTDSAVVWAVPQLDLTLAVIERMNAQ